MFCFHFFVPLANPPLSFCTLFFPTTMMHVSGGAGPVGYCRSGGLWQAETSLLSRHWRHPHVLLHRQPRQLRWEQRTHSHVAQLLHALQSGCVISGCLFIAALLKMHHDASFGFRQFWRVFFFFLNDARCDSRLNDSRRSALTCRPGLFHDRKHSREVDPWGETLLPHCSHHLGGKQEGPAQRWAHTQRAGQDEAGAARLLLPFFSRLALSHEKVNPSAFLNAV